MVISSTSITTDEYIAKTKQFIESELLKLTMTTVDLKLHEKIKYVLLSCGKRLRPLIVILSTQSVGGNRDDVMSLALAIELLHAATLVHDDIIDEDELRRGILAVSRKAIEGASLGDSTSGVLLEEWGSRRRARPRWSQLGHQPRPRIIQLGGTRLLRHRPAPPCFRGSNQ